MRSGGLPQLLLQAGAQDTKDLSCWRVALNQRIRFLLERFQADGGLSEKALGMRATAATVPRTIARDPLGAGPSHTHQQQHLQSILGLPPMGLRPATAAASAAGVLQSGSQEGRARRGPRPLTRRRPYADGAEAARPAAGPAGDDDSGTDASSCGAVDRRQALLMEMGFSEPEAQLALCRCGVEADLPELVDSLLLGSRRWSVDDAPKHLHGHHSDPLVSPAGFQHSLDGTSQPQLGSAPGALRTERASSTPGLELGSPQRNCTCAAAPLPSDPSTSDAADPQLHEGKGMMIGQARTLQPRQRVLMSQFSLQGTRSAQADGDGSSSSSSSGGGGSSERPGPGEEHRHDAEQSRVRMRLWVEQGGAPNGSSAGSRSGPDGGKAGSSAGGSSRRAKQPAGMDQEAMQQIFERDLCQICFDAISCVLFLPCGHLGTCESCAALLSQCPVDRTPITQKIKVFRM